MTSKYFLFVSFSIPDPDYISHVHSHGFHFVLLYPSNLSSVSSHVINGIEITKISIESSLAIDYCNLLSLFNPLHGASSVLCRTYLELGAPYIHNYPGDLRNYVVLGDTHHIVGCLSFCYQYLLSNNIVQLSSYANPADSLILSQLANIPLNACFLYPPSLVVRNTLSVNSSSYIDSLNPYLRTGFGLCSYLSHFQNTRSSLIRYLSLNAPSALSVIHFHDFFQPYEFTCFLRRIASYIVPTNGGQISPSVVSASFLGCAIVSNCFNQLTLHSEFSRILSLYFPLELFALSIPSSYQSLSSMLYKPPDSFSSRFSFVNSEIDFFLFPDEYFLLSVPEQHPLCLNFSSNDLTHSFALIDKLILTMANINLFTTDSSLALHISSSNISPLLRAFYWSHFG